MSRKLMSGVPNFTAKMHEIQLVYVVWRIQMYMEEPCFFVLRTKFKLSYSPHSDKRCLHDVIGFSVTVVSSAKLTFVFVDDHSYTPSLA